MPSAPYKTPEGHALGRWVVRQRSSYDEGALDSDRVHRLEELPGWKWDPFAEKWEEGFRRLKSYVDRNGHANVPQSYSIDGYRLGHWVTQQRIKHTNGSLDGSRANQLQKLPGWTWDPKSAMWEEGFRRLTDYVEQHNHARVPASYEVDGYRLGSWVSSQRGKRGALSHERERRLDGVPGWTWDARADRWEEGFGCLQQYVERHGDARVPDKFIADGFRLGHWVSVQRQNQASGKLDEGRKHRLEQLPGWTWDPTAEQWEAGFITLLDYVKRHGTARVPFSAEGVGRWVGLQRANKLSGKLDAGRQRRLQELPGWTWAAQKDQWEEAFDQLQDYVRQHGHARVPSSYVFRGIELGRWVLKQRTRYGKGSLDSDRQHRLEQLPGWTWDPHADKWEEGFNRLMAYFEHYGDARVPSSYVVGNYPLGTWVAKQRATFRRGTLDADRQRRLNNVPGWTWRVRARS